MSGFQLRTRGDVSLTGLRGPVALDEPGLVALLVVLAVAGPAGASTNELLLRLTPNATAERGRAELARLIAVLRLRLGDESSIVEAADGYTLRPGIVTMDVRVLDTEAPEECTDFLAGFKLKGSPEFNEWLVATRRRVEPLDVATTDRRRANVKLGIAATVAVVLAIAAALYSMAPRSVQGFAPGDRLLVADVKNETGDSLFDVGISRAAVIGLQQSAYLRLYPRTRLPAVYRLMQIKNADTVLSFDLAQDVAQRDRVRFVLGLAVQRAGEAYRVVGQLADVATDRVTSLSATARTKSGVLSALDSVLLGVRRRLGESRRDIADRRMPLPLVTTSSLEALRSFADGSMAWNRGQFPVARELFQRAVDLDTGFAMAYGALGHSYYWNRDRPQGEKYFGEALARADRLTEFERMHLLQSLAMYRGAVDSALALGLTLTTRYPNSATWLDFGTNLMRAGRDSAALEALQTSLKYDSTFASTYINIAILQKRRRRFDEALRAYATAGRLDSAMLYQNNLNQEWASTFVILGRYAEAESAFNRMAGSSRIADRAAGLRSLGFLAMWQGHADEEIDLFQKASAAGAQTSTPLTEARNRMLLASAYRSVGRTREANEEVTKALALARAPTFDPQALSLVATSCVRLGRIADTEAILALLRSRMNRQNPGDVGAEAYVAGLISLAKHRSDSVLVYARQAKNHFDRTARLSLAAEAFRAAGQLDSARAAVADILQATVFGQESQEDWLRAPLVLGDLMLADRDTAGAIKQYERLVDQRKTAQREVSDVAAAKSRLATLRGAPPERTVRP